MCFFSFAEGTRIRKKIKTSFSLFFAHLSVTWASPKLLAFDNKNNKIFCIVLA